MITATFHGQVIARSEQTVYLEGNHYFPPESIVPGALEDSRVRTLCFWKGLARYHHVTRGRSPGIGRGLVLPAAHTPGPDDQRPRGLRPRQRSHRQRRNVPDRRLHRLPGAGPDNLGSGSDPRLSGSEFLEKGLKAFR